MTDWLLVGMKSGEGDINLCSSLSKISKVQWQMWCSPPAKWVAPELFSWLVHLETNRSDDSYWSTEGSRCQDYGLISQSNDWVKRLKVVYLWPMTVSLIKTLKKDESFCRALNSAEADFDLAAVGLDEGSIVLMHLYLGIISQNPFCQNLPVQSACAFCLLLLFTAVFRFPVEIFLKDFRSELWFWLSSSRTFLAMPSAKTRIWFQGQARTRL